VTPANTTGTLADALDHGTVALDPGPRSCAEYHCAFRASPGRDKCATCLRADELCAELESWREWFSDRSTGPLFSKLLENPDVLWRVSQCVRELERLGL
jgi:hypothetical protein